MHFVSWGNGKQKKRNTLFIPEEERVTYSQDTSGGAEHATTIRPALYTAPYDKLYDVTTFKPNEPGTEHTLFPFALHVSHDLTPRAAYPCNNEWHRSGKMNEETKFVANGSEFAFYRIIPAPSSRTVARDCFILCCSVKSDEFVCRAFLFLRGAFVESLQNVEYFAFHLRHDGNC